MKRTRDRDDARRDYIGFLLWKCQEQMAYHDHKESSAWVVTGAIVAAGTVLLQSRLFDDCPTISGGLTVVGILTVMVLAACLVRWQLNNKRESVVRSGVYENRFKVQVRRLNQPNRDIERDLKSRLDCLIRYRRWPAFGRRYYNWMLKRERNTYPKWVRKGIRKKWGAETRHGVRGESLIMWIVWLTISLIGLRSVLWVLPWVK